MGTFYKNYRCNHYGSRRWRRTCIATKNCAGSDKVIPIAQHKEGVLEKADELLAALKAADTERKSTIQKSPDGNSASREILGIPTRIEIGPKDIEKNQVVVRRDTWKDIVVSIDEITTKLGEILETIQKDMYEKAKAFLNSHIDTAVTMDEMVEKFKSKPWICKSLLVWRWMWRRDQIRYRRSFHTLSDRRWRDDFRHMYFLWKTWNTWHTGENHTVK